jgi:hypothetical protein
MTKMTPISDRHDTARPNLALRALRPVSLALALASITILAGCANYQSVKPGMSVSEAIQKLGKPSTSCVREDGTQRLIWTMQPYGQYAWGTNTTKDGKVVEMQQLLTDKHFEVGLSFSNIPERLIVPFAALTGFHDPSVPFMLKFEPKENEAEALAEETEPPQSSAPAPASAPVTLRTEARPQPARWATSSMLIAR